MLDVLLGLDKVWRKPGVMLAQHAVNVKRA